jgi:hypothetical protein
MQPNSWRIIAPGRPTASAARAATRQIARLASVVEALDNNQRQLWRMA